MDRLAGMEMFVNVVETEGFSAAARRMGISRAAVSKQVLNLEEDLGARLLNRTTRRVGVTELGQAYYERCKRVLSEVADADLLVQRLHSEPRGTLRVSAPMSFGVAQVGPAVTEFLEQFPELDISLTLNDRFTDLIEEGFDVAVRIAQAADSSLVARRLAPVKCVMTATADYLAQHGAPKRPEDLPTHKCLSYSYLASGLEWPLSGPGGSKSVKVSGPLKANNGDVLVQAVCRGLGIAFLPYFLVSDAIESGDLVTVLDRYKLPELSVYAVSPPNRFPARKVQAFLTFLSDRFSDAEF
ncbi:MAG: LysR family transcriptional regulator [Alphaproteobacteria bacterium]